MQYRALPVEVTAHVIETALYAPEDGSYWIRCADGNTRRTAPMSTPPRGGDYWVVSVEGLAHVEFKDVFERKYAPIDRVGPRIEQVVADDPGDATEGAGWGGHVDARQGAGPAPSRPTSRAVDARYTFAYEINKVERRAARLRILMDALPASFWERPDAVEVVNDVIVGLSLPP